MQKLVSSASRIVFIAIALALIGLTFMKIIDAKDFLQIAGMVFVYYFTKPSSPDVSTTTSSTTAVVTEK